MAGYTIQKCYKLHGYPPGHKFYKGRKVAAVAQSDDTATGNNAPGLGYQAHNAYDSLSAPAVQTLIAE